jgi:hypothetical protein
MYNQKGSRMTIYGILQPDKGKNKEKAPKGTTQHLLAEEISTA